MQSAITCNELGWTWVCVQLRYVPVLSGPASGAQMECGRLMDGVSAHLCSAGLDKTSVGMCHLNAKRRCSTATPSSSEAFAALK